METLRNNEMESLKKNTVTEMKNIFDRLNRLDTAEEKTSEPEDWSIQTS